MNNLADRLVDAAAESFPMRGPIYEFGFAAGTPAAHSLAANPNPLAADPSEQIDRLEDLDHLPFPDGDANTIVCRDALSYVFEPRRAVDEMLRVLAPGGLLVVIERSGPSATDCGQRYWTVHPGALGRLLDGFAGTLLGWIGPDAAPHTVFGLACKSPLSAEFAAGVRPLVDRIDRALAAAPPPAGLRARVGRWVEWMGLTGRRRTMPEGRRVQYAFNLPVDDQSRPVLLQGCLGPTKLGARLDLSQ